MSSQGADWFKGIVTVQVRGGQPEKLVNIALTGGLKLSSIRWTSSGQLMFELSVSHFFELRPYLKETGCRVHVVKRKGLPFLLEKAEGRKLFIGGVAMFFVILYLLSSLVWSIEIEGNKRITDEQVLLAAEQEGLFKFQWLFKLKHTDQIAKTLTSKLPGSSWVGVEKKGTRITIQVVEAALPETKQLQSPRHLVASNDAVVTQIIAEAGRPVVKKNTRVKKGETLISGMLGDEQHMRTVVAKGMVRGLVWHEYEIKVPLTELTKVYTGEKRTKWYAVIGSRSLQISGFGKNTFNESETITHEEKTSWRNWILPFGRMKETIMETVEEHRELSEDEAKAVGILQAKADLLLKAGTDAVIRDEIVLHEETDNGKVYMKVLFEVEQSIIKEMPLVQ